MRGDVDTIKGRLDIAEVISGYIKLEKAGASLKARCPFHNEKTASFFVSPVRQSYYCFGCGAKGDIFSFVEEVEGLDFRGALKFLADKAGIEIEFRRGESKTEKDKIFEVLEEAAMFFEKELVKSDLAHRYIASRGINDESVKSWRIGYVPDEWRTLHEHMKELGYDGTLLLKAGLIKELLYDVFRDRIIFPLSDANGRIIAFSGRAITHETLPKYLNSPDTTLFTKSEVLYGLDKAKTEIRKKDYTVLVEGQIDLVLSHQSGVKNTVASSGTAFTRYHLERLKHLSSRIIIAFDGDLAGEQAAERATLLGTSLGFDVKVANLPEGQDPAEVAQRSPEEWKNVLRMALPAVEFFFNKIEGSEKDARKLGKQIEKKILPMIKLMGSAIEQSHFISMLAKRTGIKEEILWEDLKKVQTSKPETGHVQEERETEPSGKTQREKIEERMAEIRLWQEELPESTPEFALLEKEETELAGNLLNVVLRAELSHLSAELSGAERSKDSLLAKELTAKIQEVHKQMGALAEKKEML